MMTLMNFLANRVRYIPNKYHYNRSTFDFIVKRKRVPFLKHSVHVIARSSVTAIIPQLAFLSLGHIIEHDVIACKLGQ